VVLRPRPLASWRCLGRRAPITWIDLLLIGWVARFLLCEQVLLIDSQPSRCQPLWTRWQLQVVEDACEYAGIGQEVREKGYSFLTLEQMLLYGDPVYEHGLPSKQCEGYY